MWSSPANWRKTKSKPPHFVFTYVDYPDPAFRNRINRFDTKFRQVDTASIRSVHPSLHISPDFATRATRRRSQAGFLASGRAGVLYCTLSTPR